MNKESNIYHYTKLHVLKSIIQEDAIRMLSTFYSKYSLDDYQWIREDSKGVVESLCQSFGWNYDPDDLVIKPYLISFCKDEDSEYMWEHYGDNEKGIKLVFDKNLVKDVKHVDPDGHGNYNDSIEVTLPCIYIDDKDALKDAIMQNMNLFELDDFDEIDKIRFLVAAIKRTKPYENEQEYRHILLDRVIFRASYNDGDVKFEEDEGPTHEENMRILVLFPKQMLLGVELGANTTEKDYQLVCDYLTEIGYDMNNIRIERHL